MPAECRLAAARYLRKVPFTNLFSRLSAKLPAREVFRVRAVLAQIGWLETSVADAAAQAVFNIELLIRSGAFESSVAIDIQLEVFRAYELGLLATWETPDEVICVPSFRA